MVSSGPAAGATDDWAKGKAGVKYSFTVEIRDKKLIFLVPPEDIIPTGIETFEAFVVVADMIAEEFGPTLD